MHAVHRLHMHRLPDGPPFGVQTGNCLQNFRRAGLSVLGTVKSLRIAPNLPAHSLWIDNHGREPIVWFAARLVKGIHLHGQIPEPLPIAVIDCFFLRNMRFQMGILAADHTSNNVAHAVVVADLLVLIPRGVFARLRRPFSCMVRV